MATLKYKNGSNWTAVPLNNGTHNERWSSVGVSRTNNVYGTPTATVSKEPIDASGACEMSFKFSNLRGAPGGTGSTGAAGARGLVLYTVCCIRNGGTTLNMVNSTTDNLTSMRIAMNETHVQTSFDGYALGAYPISYNSTYGCIYFSPNSTDYRYHTGVSGGMAITGVVNATTNTSNASVKAGIAYGTSASAPNTWFNSFPIYWFTYQRQITFQEKMFAGTYTSMPSNYFSLVARRNGGSNGTYDGWQCYLTANFYGRSPF